MKNKLPYFYFWRPSKGAAETHQRTWRLQVKQERLAIQPCSKERAWDVWSQLWGVHCPSLRSGAVRESSNTKRPSSLPVRSQAWDSEHRSHLSTWRAMLGWQGPAHGLTWQSGAADGAGRGGDLGLLLSTLCSRQGWLFRLLVQLSGVGSSPIVFCLCWNSQLGKQPSTESMSVAFSIWRVGCG